MSGFGALRKFTRDPIEPAAERIENFAAYRLV
jgi:hypothetical protein